MSIGKFCNRLALDLTEASSWMSDRSVQNATSAEAIRANVSRAILPSRVPASLVGGLNVLHSSPKLVQRTGFDDDSSNAPPVVDWHQIRDVGR